MSPILCYDPASNASLRFGEALAQLVKMDPATGTRITEYKRVVAFRNLLIHGYAQIDHRIVWDVLERKVPALLREAEELLAEGEGKQH